MIKLFSFDVKRNKIIYCSILDSYYPEKYLLAILNTISN